MAVQDGFLLAFRVKNHPKLFATLVMMLASEGKPGDAIACRENGIAAYMRYPIADKQLNDAIVAVTGASVDADETPTLVTRHSLREQRKGATILLVDPHRDSHMLAAHILRQARFQPRRGDRSRRGHRLRSTRTSTTSSSSTPSSRGSTGPTPPQSCAAT